MNFTVKPIGTSRQFICMLQNVTCTFTVTNHALISIGLEGQGKIYDELTVALTELTKLLVNENLIPKINIVKGNYFLQVVARKCNYQPAPSHGVKFNVWNYQFS